MARFRVPAWRIRQIFNDNKYFEMVKSGVWTANLAESTPIARPFKDHPVGTLSQIVHYLDELGRVVAIVHQFRKPNGKIGGSGKPDPKMLEFDGDTYHAL